MIQLTPAPAISPLPALLLVTPVKMHCFTKLNTGAIVTLSLVHPEQKRMLLCSVFSLYQSYTLVTGEEICY